MNGLVSTCGNVSAGVSQGSTLVLVLFLIYVDNLTENLKCSVKLFADETSLFTVVHNPSLAAREIHYDLDQIELWAHKWRMSFNLDPLKQAVELVFSKKNVKTKHPTILFNVFPVSTVDQVKHLGIILDSKLSFSPRIQTDINKSRIAIGMLKLMSKYLPRNTINDLYKLHVRPHLDYVDVIYHIPQTGADPEIKLTATQHKKHISKRAWSKGCAVATPIILTVAYIYDFCGIRFSSRNPPISYNSLHSLKYDSERTVMARALI